MADRPIGMFDSGFGGLTVARAVIDLVPGEDLVYIGDTGRYPYGPRPHEEVRAFARQIAWRLVKEHDAKLLVVACNTAAAAGLDELADELPVPVLDVIGPGVRSLVAAHPQRAGRRDRHGRHRRRRAPTSAPSPTSTPAWSSRAPPAPASSSSSNGARRPATR